MNKKISKKLQRKLAIEKFRNEREIEFRKSKEPTDAPQPKLQFKIPTLPKEYTKYSRICIGTISETVENYKVASSYAANASKGFNSFYADFQDFKHQNSEPVKEQKEF